MAILGDKVISYRKVSQVFILVKVKRVGTVLIRGVIAEQKALEWKSSILAYAERNKDHVTGYPADNIQVKTS
jgi:hypothetical protein